MKTTVHTYDKQYERKHANMIIVYNQNGFLVN